METYHKSRQKGYHTLLNQVEEGMRSVIVTADNYAELKLIHTIRRLYQRSSTELTTKAKQDLARRFSVALKLVKEKFGDNMPDDLLALRKRLEDYQDTLDHWGLKDYQLLPSCSEVSYAKTLYTFFHGAAVILLATIPSVVLNFPVGFAANFWAYREARKDLLASRVKLNAKDVLLSKKIVFSLVAVPLLWLTYAVLLLLFSGFETRTVIVILLCCPIFSYIGIMAVEQSMIDIKDLRPAFLRLLPEFRKVAPKLPQMRHELALEVRRITRKYGPDLGSVYTDKSSDWERNMRRDYSGDDDLETPTNLEHASGLLNKITSLADDDDQQQKKRE